MKRLLGLATLLFMALPAAAAVIPVTDYDTIAGLVVVPGYGPITDDFETPGGTDVGDLTNRVLQDPAGLYYYEHTITLGAGVSNLSEFATAAGVVEPHPGLIAGYSFADVLAAGFPVAATAFSIEQDPDDSLDWTASTGDFDGPEAITFFFGTGYNPLPPGTLVGFGIINGDVAAAESYGVAPEPGTMILFGTGLLGLFTLARRRKVR